MNLEGPSDVTAGMTTGPRARWPIPSRLSPAGSRGAWQSTVRAARLIFSSVPSVAPAPTSSPRSASRPPPKHALYKSSQNHLGLSQPRTRTDSKAPEAGMPTHGELAFGAVPPASATPEGPEHPPCPRSAAASGTGVMLGVVRQRGEGLITS